MEEKLCENQKFVCLFSIDSQKVWNYVAKLAMEEKWWENWN